MWQLYTAVFNYPNGHPKKMILLKKNLTFQITVIHTLVVNLKTSASMMEGSSPKNGLQLVRPSIVYARTGLTGL